MAEMSPKMILDTCLASLRAWTGEPLASASFRKGPQRSFRLGDSESGLVIVGLATLQGGEESKGIGNHWWEAWAFAIRLAVPDDEDAPETQEDLRLDMIHELGQWMQENRTLYDEDSGAATKRGSIATVDCWSGPMLEGEEQEWRGADCVVEFGTLRS